MRQFVGIGIGVSMLGLFAVPQIVSAATVAVTVTDSGGTAISKAFIAILNADGDSIDGVITGSDGAALVETVSSNAMIITAPGFQTKSVTGAVTAQTVVLTTTTTTKLSYANSFGAQVRTVANDGESGVMYATTDNQPSVWRTSDYAGTWSPVPTSADSTTGLSQESAGDIFTSGVPGEVAVQISNALYFSRDYGNTWSSVTGYSNATGQNKKHFWMHGGAAGETSIIFVRSDSALFAAVMPDSKTDSAPSFTQVTTLGSSFVAGDKVAFAVGTSGLLYMAAVNAANTRIST
ncbi:MAG: carboxypeptidase regulatory-like domain-containing protein, partial [Ilumatobacteraceae bacterium]|nr:carboxypeptidase regulatory-like domain-containing protein [Ilumatobacteraceae bacterium]